MKQTIILILCLLGVPRGVRRIIGARLAFIRLDASIANRSFYIEQKNDTLIELKTGCSMLLRWNRNMSFPKNWSLNTAIMKTPPLYYADQCLEIARQLGRPEPHYGISPAPGKLPALFRAYTRVPLHPGIN